MKQVGAGMGIARQSLGQAKFIFMTWGLLKKALLSQPNPNLNHNTNPSTTKKLGETR